MNGDESPQWPVNDRPGRKRLFGYLRPFPALPALIEAINSPDLNAMLFMPEVSAVWRNRLASESIHFADRPVDVRRALAEADAALTHGSHAMLSQVLETDIPSLQIPLAFEQTLNSLRAERVGGCVTVDHENLVELRSGFDRVTTDPRLILEAASRKFVKIDETIGIRDALCRIRRLL